jgi:phosphatidylserine decarboxylase
MAGAAVLAALCAGAFGGPIALVVGLTFALAVLLFFRDPVRTVPDRAGAVIAPADGRVVAVKVGAKPHRFDSQATTQISIFMSPLDVHINRVPVAGTLRRIEHRKGQFRAAYADEASEVNESNSVLVEATEGYRLVVVQIAGWLARRIICYAPENSVLARGERFGLIMFGSRVDVFLPPQAKPLVTVGDRTRTGETVLALIEDAGR